MTAKRWAQVESLYNSARELPEPERSSFLQQACGGDASLRADVEALLRQPDSDAGPIDRPAWEGAEALLAGIVEPDLQPGLRLGPFEITGVIGQGGMGRVYSASDSRLGRTVAIKVSRATFGDRFEREARAVAALNHPNICTLLDVGPNYLVMELVEGATLAERIRQGPLPVAEALAIARQVADAIEAAHEKGIIHRDLKPGNIKIKPDGGVKVIDFGLAKAAAESPVSPLQSTFTQPQAILGTAAYMAPEQAAGKPVDRRADIWAFGVVLAEMLTGRSVFAGETASELLAAVMKDPPDLSRLPADVPSPVRHLLNRCLEKDPRLRLQAIGEARIVLAGGGAQLSSEATGPPSRSHGRVAMVAAALALAGWAGFLWSAWRSGSAPDLPRPVTRTNLLVPRDALRSLALSPDGRLLAYAAPFEGKQMLWIRAMDATTAHPRAGTEEALAPFWSPDSKSVGFMTFGSGMIKRVEAEGVSAPQVVCGDCQAVSGGAWGESGVILFKRQADGILHRIPATGGKAEALTTKGPDEELHSWPAFFPGGRRFLYYAEMRNGKPGNVYAAPLDQPAGLVRVASAPMAAKLIGGKISYLLYASPNQELLARRIDATTFRLAGEPIRIAERVAHAQALRIQATASDNGVIAYSATPAGAATIAWVDRQGKPLSLPAESPPDVYNGTWRLSPDNRRILVNRDQYQFSLWVYEFGRGIFTPITHQAAFFGHWSPDGDWIVYSVNLPVPGESSIIARARSNGSGEIQQGGGGQTAAGRYLVFTQPSRDGKTDLWVLPLDGADRPLRPFLETPFRESDAHLSPDGKWVAYASDEAGRNEVYIRGISADGQAIPGLKWQVSVRGGIAPRWRADSQEIYFWSGTHVMAAAVSASGQNSLSIGAERALFPLNTKFFDAAADGQKFVVRKMVQSEAAITVVTNWDSSLPK